MKYYDKRGPYQLVRHDELQTITCTRCGQVKKSKLVATKDDEGTYCNGCYGKMVSDDGLNQ